MTAMGQKFKESDSDSFAMIVLESQQKLGDDAHRYYNSLIRQLKDDTKHVQHVEDFWGDPLTAPGAQSQDGKCVYVQLNSPVTKVRPWETNRWMLFAVL
jgi:RND superfamily putative drug exporter